MKLRILMFLIYIFVHLVASDCPQGFTHIPDANERNCYIILQERLNKADAEAKCHTLDSELVLPRNEDEAYAIAWQLFNTQPTATKYWMGYVKEGGQFVDPQGQEMPDFWRQQEPNNAGGNEFCTEICINCMLREANDISCEELKSVVCETAAVATDAKFAPVAYNLLVFAAVVFLVLT